MPLNSSDFRKKTSSPIWDWVGGRFSVWGAIGLPVAIALGADTFKRFPGRRPCNGPARFDRSAAEQSAGAHGDVCLLEFGKTRRFLLLFPSL
ncbi:MAG: hypothetical protein ACLVAP_06215 [Parasutterella sp.]